MSNYLDALVYSTVKNILPSDTTTEIIRRRNISSDGTNTGANNTFNNILDKTTIKRACALNRQGIPKNQIDKDNLGVYVKIPIHSEYKEDNDDNPILHTKFGYVEKKVYVPSYLCDASNVGFTDANNNFYEIYCANQLKNFMDENDGTFDAILWSQYKPDCACYGIPDPNYEKVAQRTCYMPGCIPDAGVHKNVYLDPRSQVNPICTTTICNAINQIEGASATGNINYQSQVTQNCSMASLKKEKEDLEQEEKERIEKERIEKERADKISSSSNTGLYIGLGIGIMSFIIIVIIVVIIFKNKK